MIIDIYVNELDADANYLGFLNETTDKILDKVFSSETPNDIKVCIHNVSDDLVKILKDALTRFNIIFENREAGCVTFDASNVVYNEPLSAQNFIDSKNMRKISYNNILAYSSEEIYKTHKRLRKIMKIMKKAALTGKYGIVIATSRHDNLTLLSLSLKLLGYKCALDKNKMLTISWD